MKVAFVTTSLETGGAEVMLYKLLSRIDQNQISPVVISLKDYGTLGDKIEELHVPVYTLGIKPSRPKLRDVSELAKLLRDIKPDIVQGWMYHGNLAAQLGVALSRIKIPVLWSIHNSIESLRSEKKATQGVIKLCAFLSRLPKKILYVADSVKVNHEDYGFSKGKGFVIPNGFDIDVFRPLPEARVSVLKEFELPSTSILIGLVGRYHAVKDHKNFLKAMGIIIKRYPNVYVIMAGREIDKANKTLVEHINNLGIRKNVKLLGERADIPRLLSSLDIACSASYSEAFPMILGEAMACGVPCVATDVGDSKRIVGKTGYIVPPRQYQMLANAVEQLIAMDSVGRKQMGMLARERIVLNYSLDAVTDQYERLYQSFSSREV